MASTNKTAHYELSQYIGSDKPTYLVDYNMDMYNIDQGIYDAQSKANTNEGSIGNLSNLETTDKSTLVNAINEIESNVTTNTSNIASLSDKVDTNEGNIGDLTNLTTTAKSDLVSAVNEVQSETDSNTSNIGLLSNLTTTDKTNVVTAINEVNGKVNVNTSNITDNTNNIGDLSNLGTTVKTDLVSAINEVNSNASGWSYAGTSTGSNWFSLPTGWNELYIYIQTPIQNKTIKTQMFIHMIKEMLPYMNYVNDAQGKNNVSELASTSFPLTGSVSGSTVQASFINYCQDDNTICLGYAPGYTGNSQIWIFYK